MTASAMRIGWVGFHEEGLLPLRTLLERGVAIQGVITLTPVEAAKRSGAADYPGLCREFCVPLLEVQDINGEDGIAALRALQLDLAFVIGWTQLVRPSARALVSRGVIGAHASLLPRNRGRAPVNWALIRGERETGNTLLWLDDAVDGGEVIDQTVIPITAYDTCATIYGRVAESTRDMILKALPPLMDGTRLGTPQPQAVEPALPRRRPGDGLIDWSLGHAQVYDLVRALTRPYPGAFGWLDGRRWTVWHCASIATTGRRAGKPGTVISPVVSPVADACGQLVQCGEGMVVLLEVEGEDGRVLRGPELSERQWTGRCWRDS
jgi:methionyl-tRNA formyltransferase